MYEKRLNVFTDKRFLDNLLQLIAIIFRFYYFIDGICDFVFIITEKSIRISQILSSLYINNGSSNIILHIFEYVDVITDN